MRHAQGRAGECQMATTTEQDRVRELQRTLYRAARADPGRRFHALYDKLYRRDVLERAWGQVRRNRGAAGIDRITLAGVEQYGVDRLLAERAAGLAEGGPRALGPDGARPDRAGGPEDGHRPDLRGRLPTLLLRLPAEAGSARCP